MIGLREPFSTRFADICSDQTSLKFFGTPFGIEVEDAPKSFQMELIDLQSNDLVKEAYKDLMHPKRANDNGLLEFYQKYLQDEEYPNIKNHAKKMASVFGSTYVCEQLFSKMKLTKSKMRTSLTDDHLNATLRLATSSFKPDIKTLSQEKQHHSSQ